MAVGYLIPRGTRAALNAKAGAGTIVAGQPYLITDENRLAVGLTTTTYEVYAKGSEAGGGGGPTPPRQWVDRISQIGSAARYLFADTILPNTFAGATGNSNGTDALWPFTGRVTVDAFCFEVTTAAAGVNFALAIYDCNARGRPGALLRSATGYFGTSGLNVITFANLTMDGMYWIGLSVSASGGYGLRGGSSSAAASHFFGQPFDIGSASYENCLSQGRSYGAFPATYPYNSAARSAQIFPLIALRQVQV